MTKQGFIDHIANQHGCTKREGEKIIDMFTSSVIEAMGEGKEINLTGFGNFTINKVEARKGRNPRTGEGMNIVGYNQVRFKAGKKLKDGCNKLR
jgi:DNA-binding protein HU-beta